MNPKHHWHDPHMIRATRSLFKALYTTFGVFLLTFIVLHIGGSLYVSHIGDSAEKSFQKGIATDIAYLKEQGDTIAQSETLLKYLLEKDSENLISFLQKERTDRFIGLMGVADAEGVILGRTKSVKRLGNNVFLTSPMGRAVSTGKSVESIEVTGFYNQLFMSTARPVMKDGVMIGALFANYLTDDEYATRFKKSYLPAGAEVLFYTKEFGVYGNSFTDSETRKIISSYFTSGSEWIHDGSSGKTISFKDGSFYLIKNIVFPGLEQRPGGALIFVPRIDISNFNNITIALVTLLTFLFIVIRNHLRSRGQEHGWRYYLMVSFVSCPVLGLSFFALYLQNAGFLRLQHVPYPLYNSTIRLQPESAIYDLGFEQHFTLIVDTGDESVNAAQVGLLFDPKTIEIKSLDTSNSACSYVIENKINQNLGRVDFSCIILNQKGDRSPLVIADIVATPKQIGNFTFSFDNTATKVLANDGLGTDVLRMSQSGSYRVDDFETKNTKTSPTDKPLVVFSPTHANQSRWYNTKTARFVWQGPAKSVYSYTFDNNPNTIPSKLRTTQGTSIEIPILGDGIFYFHIQDTKGGPVTHYRIQADFTPPNVVAMHLSEDTIIAGDVVRFSFDGEDAGSGLQRNYYVDLGNHLFLPVGSQLFIPFLESGNQKIVLRVYDNAGNYVDKSQIIHVENQ